MLLVRVRAGAVERARRACYVGRRRPGVAELADALDSKSSGT